MNPLSARAQELLQKLEAGHSLTERLGFKNESKSAIFDEIASLGERAAIPRLFRFALAGERSVREGAARTMARLLAGVPIDELAVFDQEIRCLGDGCWGFFEPTDVQKLRGLPEASAIFGVLSCHWNGRIREPALRELAGQEDGNELPFFLLRLNDWVGQIRTLALAAVTTRVHPGYTPHFARNLPLVFRLKHCGRAAHSGLVSSVAALLLAPDARPCLLFALKSGERWVRREVFKIALASRIEMTQDLIDTVVRDEDPVMRLWAARNVLAVVEDDRLQPILERFRLDPFMPVRCEALNLLMRRFPNEAKGATETALFDAHSSARATARYWIKHQGKVVDFASLYRAGLGAGPLWRRRAAVLGLCETGTSADADAAAGLLDDSHPSLRKAAIQTVAILDGKRFTVQLLNALFDDSPGVSKAGMKALSARAAELDSAIQNRITDAMPRHVKLNVFSLSLSLPFWTRGCRILAALADGESSRSPMALVAFNDWIRSSTNISSTPDPAQVRQVLNALHSNNSGITSEHRRTIEFLMKPYK